jgi:hypothetical protein
MVFHVVALSPHWLGQNDRASRKIGQDLSLGFPPLLLIFSQDGAKNHPFFLGDPRGSKSEIAYPAFHQHGHGKSPENHQKTTRKSPENHIPGSVILHLFSWNERYGQIFRPTSR